MYEGFDGELDRPVAIKVAHIGRTDSSEGRAAFVKEARQLARLQHPRIVTVFDAGVEGEHRYIVSALLSGTSLLSHLKKRRPKISGKRHKPSPPLPMPSRTRTRREWCIVTSSRPT